MIEIRHRILESRVVVIEPEISLNLLSADALREKLESLVGNGHCRLVLDLSGVDTIDSAGLGALVCGLKAARQAGGDLRIVAPTNQVASMLSLTKLNRVLAYAESPGSAFD